MHETSYKVLFRTRYSLKADQTLLPETDPFRAALDRNVEWAEQLQKTKPDLLATLAQKQSPQLLWLGCSDSRVPETTLLGLQPGDVFVHRNIGANLLHDETTDPSAAAVIEYAVGVLGVKHVVLAGHTNCGACAGALAGKPLGATLDTWLKPIVDLAAASKAELDAQAEGPDRTRQMAVLNVRKGVESLKKRPTVAKALEAGTLQVHGVLHDVGTGSLQELDL
ncbi:MAG: hypothetical protein M1825_006068 [Sarcosagium campestre]|nr:MAG: hypothetical protein M1825_006068 [Sarcosagium campestre]